MRYTIIEYLTAAATAALAGLGGVAWVLADIDDAPGGMLIGVVMVAASALLTLRRSGGARGEAIADPRDAPQPID